MDTTMRDNEDILAVIETTGGGYVWDAEVFAVTLMDTPVGDDEALLLCKLAGVQQIALNASRLSFSTLQCLARIPGLNSLVLNHSSLDPQQFDTLVMIGPEIVQVNE